MIKGYPPQYISIVSDVHASIHFVNRMLDPLLVTTSGMKVVPQLTVYCYLSLILRGHGVILIALIENGPV